MKATKLAIMLASMMALGVSTSFGADFSKLSDEALISQA